MQVLVFGLTGEEFLLARRSFRALAGQGLILEEPLLGREAIGARLRAAGEALLMVRCGCWLEKTLPDRIPSSATRLPLAAFGKTVNDPAWRAPSTETMEMRPFTPRCLYLETAAARALGESLEGNEWDQAAYALLTDETRIRAVQLPELAHVHDPRLRVLQVATSVQYGGAERVAIDLADGLCKRGHSAWLAALGKPTRKAYVPERNFFDLSKCGRDPQSRANGVARLARELRVDVIHAHLISAAESEALWATGIPLTVTMHNMPQSWPGGFSNGAAQAGIGSENPKADMLVGCCQTVAAAIDGAQFGIPCRAAWNGIEAGRYAPTPERLAAGQNWRRTHGCGDGDLVLISVANPRRQKQLHRIPEIVVRLQEAMPERVIRCVLVGEPACASADGAEAQSALDEAVAHWLTGDLAGRLLQTGASEEVGVLLSAANVYLSTSDFEGLSLAQLEALASGLPVVATDVGGAGEIAREMGEHTEYYRRVPAGASASDFAAAVLESVPQAAAPRASRLPPAFHKDRMVQRMEQLYAVTLAKRSARSKNRDGVWVITNNFSMGGAQSSARRLLEYWKAKGIAVRAFTVQEEHATLGARTLAGNGVPVTLVPPPDGADSARAVARILGVAADRPPQAVLFWNLITSYKLLIADGLRDPGTGIFDVSPGEMCFRSLEDYFRKPRAELPYRDGRQYGVNLSGAVVKFAAEKETAEQHLGRPVEVIRNGVPLQIRRPRQVGGKVFFGTAARISPDKRLEDLIAAFSMAHPALPPYELHIAGKIERGAEAYASGLRELGAALPVHWRGELPGTAEFLEELDIFVMISEPAGCPNASLEAMAAGLPVIATNVGGACEQVVDGVTGRLSPRRDTAALAVALIELAHHPKAQAHFGAAGQRRAAEEFSLEAMATAYTQLCLPQLPGAV